jgi:3',5'-cyclic AMP phosphodiesterase CpdA
VKICSHEITGMASSSSSTPSVPLIQYTSDLHIVAKTVEEIEKIPFEVKAPILVIGGDICPALVTAWGLFVGRVSKLYKEVIIVPGNHEYYWDKANEPCSIKYINGRMQEACSKYGNVHLLLDGEVKVTVGGTSIRFIGGTMWSLSEGDEKYAVWSMMNDYAYIHDEDGDKITPFHTNALHEIFKSFLFAHLFGGEKVVVVTHHCPLPIEEYPEAEKVAHVKSAYFVDMREYMGGEFAWIHGHTHIATQRTFGKTKIVSSPYVITGRFELL